MRAVKGFFLSEREEAAGGGGGCGAADIGRKFETLGYERTGMDKKGSEDEEEEEGLSSFCISLTHSLTHSITGCVPHSEGGKGRVLGLASFGVVKCCLMLCSVFYFSILIFPTKLDPQSKP